MQRTIIAAAILLGACGQDEPAQTTANDVAAAEPVWPAWQARSDAEGAVLALIGGSGEPVVRLACAKDSNRLSVNVPAFRPVGSEERMSIGSGATVEALVADSRGDPALGGVSASGPVPDTLAAILGGRVSVSYGAQSSGPHPQPPPQMAGAFAGACAVAPPAEPGPPSANLSAGACRTQDGKIIPPNLLKAVGTEPFWGARVEGRCVTYSTPEDQAGTRVWTRFTGTRERGVWSGSLGGRRFVLRTRPQPGCSDGMSDRRYPLAVSLSVGGEERSGCADLP